MTLLRMLAFTLDAADAAAAPPAPAVTAATGARTSIGPIKACPLVKSAVAALFVVAAGM